MVLFHGENIEDTEDEVDDDEDDYNEDDYDDEIDDSDSQTEVDAHTPKHPLMCCHCIGNTFGNTMSSSSYT